MQSMNKSIGQIKNKNYTSMTEILFKIVLAIPSWLVVCKYKLWIG